MASIDHLITDDALTDPLGGGPDSGALVEEDWSGHDPDSLRWPHRTPVPLIATADHYLIAGTLTGRSDHPAIQVLGDPEVTWFSATGRTLSALAHHDDVYQQMLAWWTTP